MTKKHFERIAKAISAIKDANDRRRVAEMLATICAESNDRFNHTRFFKACGVSDD